MKFNNQLPHELTQSEQLKKITGHDDDVIDIIIDAEAWSYPQTYEQPEDSGCEINHIFTLASDGSVIDIAEYLTEDELDTFAQDFYEEAQELFYKPMIDMEE